MSGKTVKFMYIKDPAKPKRVLTVAREFIDDQTVVLGWAICHPILELKFDKKRGRMIAEARMLKADKQIFVDVTGQKPLQAVMNTLLTTDNLLVNKITMKHVAAEFVRKAKEAAKEQEIQLRIKEALEQAEKERRCNC